MIMYFVISLKRGLQFLVVLFVEVLEAKIFGWRICQNFALTNEKGIV